MSKINPLTAEYKGYRAEITEIAHCQFNVHYFDPENGDLGCKQKGANGAEALAKGSVLSTLIELAKAGTLARSSKHPYPEKKMRDLSDEEIRQIRVAIEQRNGETDGIAEEFKCSSSQVAGIKAAMNRK